MEELVIMDYDTSAIYIYKVEEGTCINDEYIMDLGYDPDECYWMFGKHIRIIDYDTKEDYRVNN